jgi:DHA1 family bicyclomycin/chloramphenicol resistance-like MFS transporter
MSLLKRRDTIGVNRMLLILLGSLTAVAPMSTDMYLPAFPEISSELLLAPGDVELTFSTYFIGMMVGMLCYGPISDRFGRKPPLIFGLTLYVLSAIAVAFSASLAEMAGWRFLQGLGGSAGAVMTIAIVRDLCAPREGARVMSLITLVMGGAPILAPLVGGLVLGFTRWQWIFGVLAGFGVLCLAGVALVLREPLIQRTRHLQLKPVICGYLELLRCRSFMGFVLCQAFTTGAMFAYIVGSPFVLMEIHGVAPASFGLFFGANAIGLVLASQINRLLLRRYTPLAILRAAQILPLIGATLLLANAFRDTSTFGLLLPGFFLVVSSVGLVGPNATAMALAEQAHRAGLASALHTTVNFGMGMCAGMLISILHDGTALPIALVIGAYAVGGLMANRFITRITTLYPERSTA